MASSPSISSLPGNATARRAFSDFVQATLGATGKLNAGGQRRLSQVFDLLAADTTLSKARQGPFAAE